MKLLMTFLRASLCPGLILLFSTSGRAQFVSGANNTLYYTSGNVGVGTTTPASNLQVTGTFTVNGGAGHELKGGGGNGLQLIGGYGSPVSGRIVIGDSSGWKMHFSTVNGAGSIRDVMTLQDNGFLGIGTTTPQTRLDLGDLRFGLISAFPAEGNIGEGVWGNYIIGDVNNLQRLRLGVVNDGYTRAEIFIDNSNRQDGTLTFKTCNGAGGAQPRMFIDGNGNVGIGTTSIASSSDYRLYVETGIRTRKITVDQSAWPDYVFTPAYHLPSLDSVAAYIREHGHLSELPSAQEVTANGVNLGDTQKAMVKKIEELTLYNIQLEEKLKTLEATVEKLTERLDAVQAHR